MYNVYGTDFYGKCDVVPGLFHVSSLFFFYNYVPLYPKSSHLILDPSVAGGQIDCSIEIPMNTISVTLAYMRTVLLVIAGTCLFFFIAWASHREGDMFPKTPNEWIVLVSAGLCVLLWKASYYGLDASYERASELAKSVGIEQWLVDAHFGLIEMPPLKPNLTQKEEFPFADRVGPASGPADSPASAGFPSSGGGYGGLASAASSPFSSASRPEPGSSPFASSGTSDPYGSSGLGTGLDSGQSSTPGSDLGTGLGGGLAAGLGAGLGTGLGEGLNSGLGSPLSSASDRPSPFATPPGTAPTPPTGPARGSDPFDERRRKPLSNDNSSAGPKIEIEFDENGKPTFKW